MILPLSQRPPLWASTAPSIAPSEPIFTVWMYFIPLRTVIVPMLPESTALTSA